MTDEAPPPAEGWAPVGFDQAAEQLAPAAEAARAEQEQAEAGEQPGADAGPEVHVSWRGLVQSTRLIVFGRLERKDPVWKLHPEEERAFDDSWTQALETLHLRIGPWGAAALTTGFIFASRAAVLGAQRRAKTRDTEGRTVSSERERAPGDPGGEP